MEKSLSLDTEEVSSMDNPTRTDATRWHTTPTAPLRKDAESSFENFEDLTQKLLRVPKREVDKKLAEQEQARKRKQD